jgi:hypothetical protein
MHSLADYTYDDIRAAVLSFIRSHHTGTYVLGNYYQLTIAHDNEAYQASYQMGCQLWRFQFDQSEVNQPGI